MEFAEMLKFLMRVGVLRTLPKADLPKVRAGLQEIGAAHSSHPLRRLRAICEACS